MRILFGYVERRWVFAAQSDGVAEGDGTQGTTRWLATMRQRIDAGEDELARRRQGRLVVWLERMRGRIDGAERILIAARTIPEVEVVYPVGWSEKRARRFLRLFLRYRLARHRGRLLVCVLLLPVTALLTILPGPNIFFFWNVYRLICHHLAGRGAKRLLHREGVRLTSFMARMEGRLEEAPAPAAWPT
jgi:hypothetical protein